MRQDELEARLAQIAPGNNPGRLVFTQTTGTRKIQHPATPSQPSAWEEEVSVPVYLWYDPGTGTALKVEVNTDGTYNRIYDGVDQQLIGKPATTPAEQQGANGTSKRTPVKGVPGYSEVTTSKDGQEETHYEKDDAPGVAVQLPGESKNEQITYEKDANGRLVKKTTVTVNGVTSSSVQPVDPKDRTAIGTSTTVKNGKTVKTTRWQLPDGSTVETVDEEDTPPKPGTIVKGGGANGEDVQAIADPTTGQVSYQPIPGAQVPAANQPLPAGSPKYVPDYTKDDLGLAAFNEELIQARDAGKITQQQGAALLEQAGAMAQTTATHGATIRNQGLTQRGQDIGEVQSRRTFQGAGFDTLFTNLYQSAPHMGAGHGGIIADAFREALAGRQAYAGNVGGFNDIPQVPGISPAVQAARASAAPAAAPAAPAAQTTVAPDGTVTINHTPPQASQNPPGVRTGAEMTGRGIDGPPTVPVFRPTQPDPGDAPVAADAAPVGQVPGYLRPAPPTPPTFDPSQLIQQWRAQGISDDVIAAALKAHEAEWGPVGRVAA